MATAWILYEGSDGRSAIAVALAASGYEDIVAFEDAGQLLAHRAGALPAVAVVDAWTARFDDREVRELLAGTPVLLLTSEEHGEAWDWSGTRKVPKPPFLDELEPAVLCALASASEARTAVASPSSFIRPARAAPRGRRR